MWPYAVVAIAAVFALVTPAPYLTFAGFTAGLLVAFVPSSEALVRHEDFAFLMAAVAIGFAVLGASFTLPRLARDPGVQTGWVVVGLVSAVTAPSILFLTNCSDKDGLATLTSSEGRYLVLVALVSAALVATSYALGARARNKLVYRLLEIAGLLQIFTTFTILSLIRYNDGFYPIVILALGAVYLVVGATTKRATLVLLASAALLLNLSIQYFAKLWDVLPASLLVLVFGLMLLAGGVVYERRLKHVLPGLREWA
jgi:hypothetical protein